MNRKLVFTLLLLTSLTANAQRTISNDDVKELVNRMEGAFDSKEQSDQDSSYFNIVLHMKRIWSSKKSKDGHWLYVEQAIAGQEDKPYRQRIYRVSKKDNQTIESKVYEIPDAMRYAGAWQDVSKLKGLRKDSLIDRQRCAVYLQLNEEGNFWGSTPGKECLSTLRGSAYATSEVVIYPSMLVSWDRGWDKSDKQIWGAEQGGYRFRKWMILRGNDEDD